MAAALLPATLAATLAGCASPPLAGDSGHAAGASLRFIGEQRLAWRQAFRDTTVGGLSGIDYDPARRTWMLVSDDRSGINPARYYTAALDYDAAAFRSVTLTGVHYFQQPGGGVYPDEAAARQGKGEVPDIEAVRYDPLDGSIWYASEGSRRLGIHPFVRHATADGRHLASMPVPERFRVWPGRQYGVRDNLAFEGISFAPGGRTLWVGMEAPLYQDGGLPTAAAGAVARITQFDREGRVLAQYAYPVDAIPGAAAPGGLSDNGVSEILAIDESHLYVLERAGMQDAGGGFRYHARLFEIGLSGASDIRHIEALQGRDYAPVRKRLVCDLGALPLEQAGNVEGMAWGARLANGNDTLVLVTDDNFKRNELSQLLLFEAVPRAAGR